MRYTLENGELKTVVYVKTEITNPSDEVLDVLKVGKPLIEEILPDFDESTESVEYRYEETSTEIVKRWVVVGLPVTQSPVEG